MFIALRRLTLLWTILLERFVLQKVHENATLGAVVIMITGQLLDVFISLLYGGCPVNLSADMSSMLRSHRAGVCIAWLHDQLFSSCSLRWRGTSICLHMDRHLSIIVLHLIDSHVAFSNVFVCSVTRTSLVAGG